MNTVVPCLRLFPGCKIIATDLSPQLLLILRAYVSEHDLNNRIACVCTDAMRSRLIPSSFDVVVGGSILHHLRQPELALTAAYRALKDEGLALFVEPFEGYAIIRVAFELILARAERDQLALPDALVMLMKAMILDLRVRSGTDKSAPIFAQLDDKWLFTRAYLDAVVRNIGYSSMTLVPLYEPVGQYRLAAQGLLKVGANLPQTAMPDWAWAYIDKFDQSFSTELKSELTLECAIGLRK
jgi:SAM-dependent methyltransferase